MLNANGMLTVGGVLRGLPWDVTERGANAAEAMQAPRPQVVHLFVAPRRRDVPRADLKGYGVTSGCAACSDIIGEQLEHHLEGHGRVQPQARCGT